MHTLHTLLPLLPFLLLTTPATSTPALPLALTATLLITTHTTQLYTCPSPWTYFCFRSGTPPAATSSCECYAMTPATATCPTGTRKYCSDYITTECSCSYPKQPDCPPMFDFECVPAPPEMRKEATWGGKAKDMVDMGETEVEDVEDMVELVEVEGDENWDIEYELK
ncbi:hypothetical protein P167DRAFT_568074 [Morchella conica CCBAS932]|uniref:Uncharacterized protein n=1 Tax=Morchella conica CCBAS932 TaxID=1392247 RepID=A0A3N4KR53_9PEZI|nr:hypothetical protein P167DRAFT_568074 [Morchella conica CCBAS932]